MSLVDFTAQNPAKPAYLEKSFACGEKAPLQGLRFASR
jgi:hypothetical protein